ncbi:hypothetical protein BJX61DRAFT_505195 [Aspergillus egyptiacus]|nr:hypothetical protein BJX61DRAFT_505195 [Aspergillus egyptiacus]
MSGAADERWSRGNSYNQNRQSGQRQPNPRTMSAQGGPRAGQQNLSASNNNWGDSREQHVAAGGFNVAEAKAALKRAPGAPKPLVYKPEGKDVNNRASGPWGAKPNTMANGKDFFLELRKQITALRQGGTVAGG